MVEAWKTGDADTLADMLVSELKAQSPQIYREIFVDRNNNWLPTIEDCRNTPQIESILVGAGHMVGPEGLFQVLQSKGDRIEKL